MKKLLPVLIVAICFFGCKKEARDTTALNATLAGKWELRVETSGTAGPTLNVSPGNGNIYQFNQDGTYTHYTAGLVEDSGTYTIQENVTDASGVKANFIRFSGTKSTFVLQFSGNMFLLSEDYTNATESGYAKLP